MIIFFVLKKLQLNPLAIILQFRLHPIVFTADIKQLFSQIVVTEAHQQYQQLLYHFSLHELVKEYKMNTITFGQYSSLFLVIRTFYQLAEDKSSNYPFIKAIVQHDLYVDDVVTRANSEDAAIEIQKQLENVFSKKFQLRKGSTNSEKRLNQIPLKYQQTHPVTFDEYKSEYMKVLGLN